MIPKVVDADDVGVVEAGRVLRFTSESRDKRLITGKLRVEDLHSDATTQGNVVSRENITHPTSGQMAGDPIAACEHAWFSHEAECYLR